MTIVLEMPASLESYPGLSTKHESEAVESANEAVALLESEAPAEDQETIGEKPTVPSNETAGQVDETSTNMNGTPAEATENRSAVNETCQECNCDSVEPSSVKVEFERTPRQVAEAEFLRNVRRATDELADATLSRLRIEAELKDAKSRCKLAAQGLQQLIDRGPQIRTRPQPSQSADEPQEPVGAETQHATEGIAPDATSRAKAQGQPTSTQPVIGDAWRDVPLSALQLKPKIQERLEEVGVDTIGRLEDLRAEIANHREKWPKGIGKAKITEIEDAVIAWLSKNRDAQVLAEAQANSQAQVQVETGQDGESEFDPCARAVEIDDLANPADLTNLDPKHPDGAGYWQSGVDAYNQDAKVSECPYVAGPEADDWIRGWLSAGKDDQGQERSENNGNAVSLDDL